MKNIEVQNVSKRFKNLQSKKLPIKLSLIIARNERVLSEAAVDIENRRIELLREYAEKDKNGEIIVDDKGNAKIVNVKAFTEELEELYETELNLNIEKVSEELVQKTDEDKYDSLTLEEVSALTFMIEG